MGVLPTPMIPKPPPPPAENNKITPMIEFLFLNQVSLLDPTEHYTETDPFHRGEVKMRNHF